jgi:hypothetical protein
MTVRVVMTVRVSWFCHGGGRRPLVCVRTN